MNRIIFLFAFLLSLLLHVALFTLYHYFFQQQHIINDPKKVKVSFKKGADIYTANKPTPSDSSKVTKNSNIVKNATRKPSNVVNPNISKKRQVNKKPSNKSEIVVPEDNINKTDDGKSQQNLNYDISSLQLYGSNTNTIISYATENGYKSLDTLPKDLKNEIEQLYGKEFGDYGDAQKDFIMNNLRDIGRITQYHLNVRGYPADAGYLGQQGENAVEFYIYPNGDISDLRIIVDSKSLILDKNTLRTIQIAYKDYPRPETKTKIRIYVRYHLYH